MKTLYAALALGMLAAAAQAQTEAASAAAVPAAPAADDSLFRAFGGQQGLRTLVDDVVERAVQHPQIGHFFADTNLKRLREQLTSQLCAVTGGPCQYAGDSMVESHKGMGVRPADFNKLVELLQDAMDAAQVPFTAQNRLLARLAPMHREIIEPRS